MRGLGHPEEGNVAGQVAELKRPIPSKQPAVQVESVEIIFDAAELAAKLRVPRSWVLEQTRSRAVDPIPCLRLGKYVRFKWNSQELNAWLERRTGGRSSGQAD